MILLFRSPCLVPKHSRSAWNDESEYQPKSIECLLLENVQGCSAKRCSHQARDDWAFQAETEWMIAMSVTSSSSDDTPADKMKVLKTTKKYSLAYSQVIPIVPHRRKMRSHAC